MRDLTIEGLSNISKSEFAKGIEEFRINEKRDAMYKVASFIIKSYWGRPSDMVDGLSILLSTWNQAFYRYGSFDPDALEKTIVENMSAINAFREREIFSLSENDEKSIILLFGQFHKALAIASGKKRGTRSPVSVAKTLHLLAPAFFPLWDDKIARAHGCYYNVDATKSYVRFCWITKGIAELVRDFGIESEKSLVKLIDEYNYSRYTKQWV